MQYGKILKSAQQERHTKGSKMSKKQKKIIKNPKKFKKVQPEGLKNKTQRQKAKSKEEYEQQKPCTTSNNAEK